MKKKTVKPQLDLPTIDYVIKFCENERDSQHSRMVARSYNEVIDHLKELKENCNGYTTTFMSIKKTST